LITLKNNTDIIALAKRTIQIESTAISDLIKSIDSEFAQAVKLIYKSKGRVVITGIGKSANIANKIVATLNSTGTPAIFMHAADAIHGDLGNIQKDDVVICISNSGTTPEIKLLIPFIKQMGNSIIAMVGNPNSFLAEQANFKLDTSVKEEACPINLAPTSSTTAQLVMGDAIAVCLLELNNFKEGDFAKYHPGGTLGKKLYLKVSDIYVNNELPQVASDANIKEVILEISSKRLGVTAVVNDKVIGIITDGDLRRMLESHDSMKGLTAEMVMTKKPINIDENEMAVTALDVMQKHNITQLMVLKDNKYAGIIHLHDLIREGIY
jgi:arabinose-5-phosphate isomerase